MNGKSGHYDYWFINRSAMNVLTTRKTRAARIVQIRRLAGSRIRNALARRKARVSHSSGRLIFPGGWRPDQPDPIGAYCASPTPARVLTFDAIQFKHREGRSGGCGAHQRQPGDQPDDGSKNRREDVARRQKVVAALRQSHRVQRKGREGRKAAQHASRQEQCNRPIQSGTTAANPAGHYSEYETADYIC